MACHGIPPLFGFKSPWLNSILRVINIGLTFLQYTTTNAHNTCASTCKSKPICLYTMLYMVDTIISCALSPANPLGMYIKVPSVEYLTDPTDGIAYELAGQWNTVADSKSRAGQQLQKSMLVDFHKDIKQHVN